MHGGDLLKRGFTVAQVVHDYGDVCQAVTELAEETQAPITIEEFHTLNRCLDDAIAEAVTEYMHRRERSTAAEGAERLGVLSHELRNNLSVAMLSFEVLRRGSVGIGGSTGTVLLRALRAQRDLINRSFTEVRLQAKIHDRKRLSMAEFIEEIEVDASLEATMRGIELTVSPVEQGVDVEADRQLLGSAVTNLLQNAFKFTHPHSGVSLLTTATADHVLMEVEDECGGLSPGVVDELFRPFVQRSDNRTGLGLGLSISQKGVEANGGTLRVRDIPGKGCVFSIELPRLPSAP